jgi:uncharacterized protein
MNDLDILKRLGCPESVIRHSIAVSENALSIARRVKIPVDRELVRRGGLFHDLGRCKTHGIDHAIVGGRLARKLGLGEEIARIAERHIGAGIDHSEAEKLGLPPRDYLPMTPEEKIIAYADNLTQGSGMLSFEEGLEKFKEILGEGHPSIKRMMALHDEIQAWINR